MVLCAGKIYYELMAHRREQKISNVAIVRMEQFYPFPEKAFETELKKWNKAKEIVWCQEEPRNMGMWYWFVSRQHLLHAVDSSQELLLVSRPASASPAVGYYTKHNAQQKAVIEGAFGPLKSPE